MTAIWQNDESGWHLLSPTGFPNEEKLHTLVEKAPHLLPLAGSPRLIVPGREVQLGNGYADLIAIEPTGRIAIIEIKLARNAEARRAVIAQVLAYAAHLWKLDQTTREQDVLDQHLRKRGYKSLAHAVESNDQEGSTGEGWLADGAADFIASIDAAPETSKPLLQRVCNWAIALEKEHLVKLSTYHGKAGILTLLPRLRADNAGLISIYNNNGAGYLQFWRSVFERRAPRSLARIEQSIMPIKQGNTIREVNDELLEALTDAYREAVGGKIEA